MRIRTLCCLLLSPVAVSQLYYCGQYNATESWLGLLLSNTNLDVNSSGWNYRHKLTIQNGAYAESFRIFSGAFTTARAQAEYAGLSDSYLIYGSEESLSVPQSL